MVGFMLQDLHPRPQISPGVGAGRRGGARGQDPGDGLLRPGTVLTVLPSACSLAAETAYAFGCGGTMPSLPQSWVLGPNLGTSLSLEGGYSSTWHGPCPWALYHPEAQSLPCS